jgi:hypothetical protein
VPEPPVSPDPDELLAAARGQSVEGLLAMLEQLDGAEECAVVRGALEAGVPAPVVLEELQHEVERRLMRQRSFYDEAQW